jgi:hypothetical protein
MKCERERKDIERARKCEKKEMIVREKMREKENNIYENEKVCRRKL